jgi:apolipoprotein N-acyltransferase
MGLLSAVGLVLAFPPVSFWPACLLIVWPILRLAERAARGGGSIAFAAALAGAGTIPAWVWLVRWSFTSAPAGAPFLVLYLAVFPGLTVWAVARVRRRWAGIPLAAVAPVVWVAVELFRGGVAFHGFPWFLAAHPLIDAPRFAGAPVLAWPAAFVGTYAVSGLLVLVTVLLDGLIHGVRARRAAAFARPAWGLAILVALVGGALVVGPSDPGDEPSLRVGIVQTDVPQSIRTGWPTPDRWNDWLLMRDLITWGGEQSDLVVIPETMFPGFVLQPDGASEERRVGVAWEIDPDPESGEDRVIRAETVREDLLSIQRHTGTPILIGAARYEGFRLEPEGDRIQYANDRRFNSVFLIEHGRVGESYDKRRLTPFGEVMPYISAWGWLERTLVGLGARGMAFDLGAGRRLTVFAIPVEGGEVRVVTPVCFEATVPGVCRELVFEGGRRRAEVLINLTNDGWFYDARGGRELHMLTARWRCVELATPMIRSANTGISAVIDRTGRVTHRLPTHQWGVLLGEVRGGSGSTVYARVGEAIAWICFAGTIFALLASYRKRNGEAPASGDIAGPTPGRPMGTPAT